MDEDEFEAGGFAAEAARTIHAPLIAEAFLSLECTLVEARDLTGAGQTAMVTGRVRHAWVEEAYAPVSYTHLDVYKRQPPMWTLRKTKAHCSF